MRIWMYLHLPNLLAAMRLANMWAFFLKFVTFENLCECSLHVADLTNIRWYSVHTNSCLVENLIANHMLIFIISYSDSLRLIICMPGSCRRGTPRWCSGTRRFRGASSRASRPPTGGRPASRPSYYVFSNSELLANFASIQPRTGLSKFAKT